MIDANPSPPAASTRPIRVGVWNYYEEITRDGFLFKNAQVSIGADLLKPWVDLYAHGQANGIEFLTLDQISSPDELDAVIFMDRPRPGRPMVEALMRSKVIKYLMIYECEVIKPDNWDPEYHRQFDRIFTWNDALVDGQRYIKINFATDLSPAFDFTALKAAFPGRKLVTLIAGAKKSSHPKELYSDRVRSIRWYEVNAPEDFDLYGVGWDAGEFPSYRGKVTDKLATLAHYRFSICYENAKEIPGYITEKVLDCLRAGTVPIYGGAPNIERWIPADCFIDLRKFSSYVDLHRHLHSMDSQTHQAYLERIERFLASNAAQVFSCEHFVSTVAGVISRDIAQRLSSQQDDKTRAAPEPSTTIAQKRDSFKAAGGPELIVYFGYGDELPVFRRARLLWQFFLSHYPNVRAMFSRTSSSLPLGQVLEQDGDLVVGIGGAPDIGQAPGYAASGIWAPKENWAVIYRQMAVYRHLLATNPGPFHLFQTTVTSVIDFRGLHALLSGLPKSACFAGSPARLSSPADLAGLTFNSGANTLLSRDVMELMLERYDPQHPTTAYPNDVWQALILQDLPRIPLPFFSFIQPRDEASRARHVPAITKRLVADGHFHFRVKTTSEEAGIGLREETDPWVMAAIMESIQSCPDAPGANRRLQMQLVAAVGGRPLSGRTDTPLYSGPRAFPMHDEEIGQVYPDLAV